MPKRHFIERRHGKGDYAPVGMQPANGFSSIGAAHRWLAERGWITRRVHEGSGEPYWHGLGGERGFYTRAVPVRVGDFPTPKTKTLADSRMEFERLRIPLEVRELPRRRRAWRALRARLRSA